MRNKVVVTGATGLVGSHLLLKLVEDSSEVVALYRNEKAIELVAQLFAYYEKSAAFHLVTWRKVDVLNETLLTDIVAGATTIYHTAALVSFEKKDSENLFLTNVGGTKNVLNAIAQNGIPNLVFISSVASIRNKDNDGYFNAEGIIDGKREWSDYARSKTQSEALVLEAKKGGLNTVIVNPGVILGPGDITKSSTVIFNTIKQGLSFYTLGVNGFVDVRDVVDSVFYLKDLEATKDRYVCVGENCQFKELFSIIAKALAVKEPRFKANRLLLAIAWRLELLNAKVQKKSPKITRDNTSTALGKIEYSSKSLEDDTGIVFRSMKEATDNAAAFFRYLER